LLEPTFALAGERVCNYALCMGDVRKMPNANFCLAERATRCRKIKRD
jgi:hypothetical protein